MPLIPEEEDMRFTFARAGGATLMAAASALCLTAPPAHAASLGPYNIRNLVTGQCVDIPGFGAGKVDGRVQQFPCNRTTNDNQRFWLVERGTAKAPSGNVYKRYQIRNVKDGLCLDVPNFGANPNGTAVTQFRCAGPEDNQYFYAVPRARGGSWFVNEKSRRCLDVEGKAGGSDARLTLFSCSDTDDHRWSLVR
jgi:hypothetical protein